MDGQRRDLHYVANIEVLDPLCLVQKAKDVTEVKVGDLVFYEIVLLFNTLLITKS